MKVGLEERQRGLDLETLELVSIEEVDVRFNRGEEEEVISLLESNLGRNGVGKLLYCLIERVVQDSIFVESIDEVSQLILSRKH